MQVIVVIVVVAIATVAVGIVRRRLARGPVRIPNLRLAVLGREIVANDDPSHPAAVQAALMDWGVGNGTATIAAFYDGTLSLYTNAGGGVIGGGSHESARRAGTRFLTVLAGQASALTPTDNFACPGKDQVTFWLVERERTLSSGPIPVSALQSSAHPLSAAGNAAQSAISALREATAASGQP